MILNLKRFKACLDTCLYNYPKIMRYPLKRANYGFGLACGAFVEVI